MAGIGKRAVSTIGPQSLGPLLGAFFYLRYQVDALNSSLGRFGLMCMSRFGTERLAAEPLTLRQMNSGAAPSVTSGVMNRQLEKT